MSSAIHREGIEAGRLDMFVDGAFAFTLTLLAIGGETIPDTPPKLLHLLGALPASAACFVQIASFWHGHVKWRHACVTSTRTGLLLSLALVFLVLVFVYPLHMVYASLAQAISGGALSPEFELKSGSELGLLFAIYGLAYTCMAGTLALLFRHAARLETDPGHALETRVAALSWTIGAGVGLLSAIVAMAIPADAPPIFWAVPGCIYSLLFFMGMATRGYRRRYAVVRAGRS
jgi:uncharacterized membrane protein